jgi:ribosomal protein S18 acetylase RimI-like enzyme
MQSYGICWTDDCMIARLTTDADLERIAAGGWPGLRQAWLGDWLLRAGTGWTGRANSVLPIGDPGLPLDDALTRVHEWYAEQGLPPLFQVALPCCAPLDQALQERGWEPYNFSGVLTADVADVLATTPAGPVPRVELRETPDADWLAAYNYRGGALPPGAEETLRAGDRPLFARIEADGRIVAIGRFSVSGPWVGVTAVEVDPAARRRGLAGHLMREGLRQLSATACYLQVADTNAPALALYARLGFFRHHSYRYLREKTR